MFDAFFFQQVVNGLSQGLVYALMAIGFTLIFGVLNVVNFAHGELYMLGAFAGLWVIQTFAPPLVAVLLLVAAVGLVSGVLLERIAFRPLRRFADEASLKSKAIREATLLSSLAISIVVRELVSNLFGSNMQTIPQQYLLMTPVTLGPLTFASGQFVIFGFALAMLLALQWFLFYTRSGLSVRAVAGNLTGALHVGINIQRTIVLTFMLGAALGAVSGFLVGLYSGNIFPAMGFGAGIKAFVAMVMGGLNSIPGAIICALILGLSEAIATEYIPQGWADLISYGLLLLTLLFFPNGIFGGRRERV
ncbi:branched-chain amino acid ABC transporter permease [Acerihabitans sp. KWT182]|uniref:Branched-chain amino acid ABC transporter permease n=1 Tax=Acerihabitans sp. KWT182 TaxID=3157919 RepID=A0AAU7QDY0_9GAMM